MDTVSVVGLACLYVDTVVSVLVMVYLAKGRLNKSDAFNGLLAALPITMIANILQSSTGLVIVMSSLLAPFMLFLATKVISKEADRKVGLSLMVYILLSSLTSLPVVLLVLFINMTTSIVIPLQSVESSILGTVIGDPLALVLLAPTLKVYNKLSDVINVPSNINFGSFGISLKSIATNIIVLYLAIVTMFYILTRTGSTIITTVLIFSLCAYGIVTHKDTIGTAEAKLKLKEAELNKVYTEYFKYSVGALQHTHHNIANIIQAFHFALLDEEITKEELKDIIQEAIAWDTQNSAKYNVRVIEISHPIIAGILSSKHEYAIENNVQLLIYPECDDIKDLDANIVDIIQTFTVIIDNAIEVASLTNTKIVNVIIESLGNKVRLTVSNEVSFNSDGSVKKRGNSNKVGLSSVNRIVKKYEGASFEYSDKEAVLETNEYVACLVI